MRDAGSQGGVNDVFTYTVRDTTGLLSNEATVDVTVNAIVEALTIKTAQYDRRKAQWNISGSSSQRVGNNITLTLIRADGTTALVRTVPVGANGSWQYKGAGPAAAAGDQIRAVSTFGTIATRAVQIK